MATLNIHLCEQLLSFFGRYPSGCDLIHSVDGFIMRCFATDCYTQEVIDTSTCNVSKSCFRSPTNCASDCEYALTWTYDGTGQSVSFELESIATSMNYWVAFGLSTDTSMVVHALLIALCLYVH